MIDMLIISVAFSTMQYVGFGLLVFFYLADVSHDMIASRLAAKQRQFAVSDEGYQRI